MAFTPEEEAALRVLIAQDPKIISDLESEVSLNGDETLPVEDGSGTFAATVDDVKNYTKKKINESASTATAAGTTTLTNTSAPVQIFTGTTTQICVLPNGTTLKKDDRFTVQNESTDAITTNFNGGSLAITVPAKSKATLQIIDISTSAGTWILLSEPASATRAGIMEIATSSEINTGTDDTRAITPAGLLASGYAVGRRIARLTASSSASLAQALSTGKKYAFHFINITPATNNSWLTAQLSSDGGSTLLNTNYLNRMLWATTSDAAASSTNKTSGFTIAGNDSDGNTGINNTTNRAGLSGIMQLFDPSNSALYTAARWDIQYAENSSFDYNGQIEGSGRHQSAVAINWIEFKMKQVNSDTNNGNIASGYIDVYEFN